MTTWKQKMAADTARVQNLPNYLGNLPGGPCARFFGDLYIDGSSDRVCKLPDGHEGECSDRLGGRPPNEPEPGS